MINEENWTYCSYETGENQVNIAMGGELNYNNEYLEVFFVNKFNGELLLHQDICSSIFDACNLINNKYGHWDFNDKTNKEKSSGCSSCQAH